MSKSPDAFRTISEVADDLDVPQHVLRFWETRFGQIRPMKRGGGRRYYRPEDIDLLRGIRHLLYGEGYTIRGVQRILKEQGPRVVIEAGRGEFTGIPAEAGGRAPETDYDDDGFEDAMPAPEAEPAREAAARPMPASAPRPTAASVLPVPARERAGLSTEDAKRLQATLAELLDCKRLLDQVR